MNDRPTPETDALDCELHNPRVLQDRYSEMMEHAQNMERERDEAREALDRASLYISNFTGSCPYDLFNIEPHDSPCSEACDKYANDMHLCWKKHFANKEAAK